MAVYSPFLYSPYNGASERSLKELKVERHLETKTEMSEKDCRHHSDLDIPVLAT
jgi:hypothetical protein